MTTTETCTMCNRSGEPGSGWHDGMRHPLTLAKGTGGGLNAPQNDEQPSDRDRVPVETSAFPFDPVLRQALINKGVIDPEDLSQAEIQIRAVSGMMMDMMGGTRDTADRPGATST